MKDLSKILLLALAVLFAGSLSAAHLPGHGHDSTLVAEGAAPMDGPTSVGTVTLAEVSACESIQAHAPVAAGNSFTTEVGKVWVYSKFELPLGEQATVTHVYYFKGKKISEVPLVVKGPSFRTNSYKTITPAMVGPWKVEIVAENGTVFEALEFEITE